MVTNTPEDTRRDQLAFGRTTISVENDRPAGARPSVRLTDARPFTITGVSSPPRTTARVIPKGHDVILKAMQDNAQIATIVTSGGGELYVGTITGRDKYTITLMTEHPTDESKKIRRVFYKSAIEQFWGEEVPRAPREVIREEKVAA
jgi:hypothetical protein